MITIRQCRAARGLLDWTQQDLADKAGLSKTAINNFEKGYSDIKAESLRAIQRAFENRDIEFIAAVGVQEKSESAKILKGKTAFHDLLKDIEQSLGSTDEILINAINPKFAEHYGDDINTLFKTCRAHKISVRILCTAEAALHLPSTAMRILPETQANIIFLYARKTAILLWGFSAIVIIDSPEAAAAERQHFENLWNEHIPAKLKRHK